MRTNLFLKENGVKTLLCSVDLEVVPGGTYVVDGVPYKLSEKPTFHIDNPHRRGDHILSFVDLEVERIPEARPTL